MAFFNKDEYEMVDERIKKFYADNPDGRIISKLESENGDICEFSAWLYLNKEEQEKNCPKASGWAHEIKNAGNPVNKTSHFENCETSAIGRALANAGYSGKKRASLEEMEGAAAREQAEATKAPDKAPQANKTASQTQETDKIRNAGDIQKSQQMIALLNTVMPGSAEKMTKAQLPQTKKPDAVADIIRDVLYHEFSELNEQGFVNLFDIELDKMTNEQIIELLDKTQKSMNIK